MGQLGLKPHDLAELISLIDNATISGKIAKDILPELLAGAAARPGVRQFVESKGLVQISDENAIAAMIDEVLSANQKQLQRVQGWEDEDAGLLHRVCGPEPPQCMRTP